MAPQTEERELISAQARYVRASARKARLVLEHIRGISAAEAQAILQFQTRAVAKDAGKVLKSAVANAENNFGHDPDDLVVVVAYADEGPTLKRWRPRARGRVNRIRKRTCHITIKVSPALPGEIKPRSERPVRQPRQPRPEPETVEETITPSPAAAEEAAAAEPEVEETPDAEVVEDPEAEAAAETEAAPEPEPEPEPEAAAEPEPAAEEEPAAEGADENDSPKPDEEAKS